MKSNEDLSLKEQLLIIKKKLLNSFELSHNFNCKDSKFSLHKRLENNQLQMQFLKKLHEIESLLKKLDQRPKTNGKDSSL